LFSQDMYVHQNNAEGVWYEGDENKATFRWKTSPEGQEGDEINFAVCLYPDGRVEFYYDEMILEHPIRWSAGISDGDYYNNSFPLLPSPPNIPPGTKVELIPPVVPDSVSLSKSGELEIFDTDPGKIKQIKVAVCDNTLVSATKTFQLSDGIEYTLYLDGCRSF